MQLEHDSLKDTVNPLLIPLGGLIISNVFWGGRGGLNREGGLISEGRGLPIELLEWGLTLSKSWGSEMSGK